MAEPRRIGLVCPYSLDQPGGVQQQVLGLADWLRQQGRQVSVLAPGDGNVEQLVSTGAAVPIRWNGSTARIAAGPVTAARVHQWLRAVRPEVLHLHEPCTPSAAGWALALAEPSTPILATFHAAVDLDSMQSRLARGVGRLLRAHPRWADRIQVATAPSRVAAETARRHWGIEPRIVPNGLDLGPYADAGEVPAGPPGVRRLLFLGRLDEPRKGLPVLLAALPLLREKIGAFELTVAGPGRVPLQTGYAPEVRMLGLVTEAEKQELLRRTEVLIAPNTHGESFGIVLIEALAAGAGVVASALPGFAEVLGPLGQTCTIGDPGDLVRAIADELAADPDPAPRRARAATFDWSRVGPMMLDGYLSVARG